MAKKRAKLPKLSIEPIRTVAELEDRLSCPTPGVVEAMAKLDGDLLILGAGGKIGPTLAQMAARAFEAAGVKRSIIGVSNVYSAEALQRLKRLGVKIVKTELLEPGALDTLPDAANVMYMLGMKFGSTGAEWNTWGVNVHLAGMAASRYRHSRIVAFSSGNIYPFLPIGIGATEQTTPSPIGEYAMSCLGRERMFDYYSNNAGTKVLHYRLNYAVELRYGIVYDIASKVWSGAPIDVTMGFVNVIWQGYANAVALQSFAYADSPPGIINVAGPETVSIRWMAQRFGELMGKEPIIEGEEAANALLSNGAKCHKLFGMPDVGIDTVVEWVAHWIMSGGVTLGKPTHYETRDGKF
ncbi:MAG TPA: NAD-dependent epimerase/dehydratase family protein [Candidatus Hydrogenedentes bacterium]|nr:NAD-dependent epimerase/dehydratase family protein [Candidatus Hydrogenedentota bacterium]HPG69554.1 NAD-dependent epimerase/dehydratase family protein [Candidatus Hydrogenedentota bacterium]